MLSYTVKELQDRFKQLGYNWYQFHLIGVRARNCEENTFCDSLILCNDDQVYTFAGTTRPGTYYLLHLLNPKGAAVLKPDQYVDTWTLGFHRNKPDHLAWIQAKPVTVYRDNDFDTTPEQIGVQDKGFFGINIHRSNPFSMSKLVDKWSAGCQVFANSKEFAIFVELSKKSEQKFFTYTLLEEF